MLELRPIVVNKDMIILGGNMRFKSLQGSVNKKIPVIVADNLTESKRVSHQGQCIWMRMGLGYTSEQNGIRKNSKMVTWCTVWNSRTKTERMILMWTMVSRLILCYETYSRSDRIDFFAEIARISMMWINWWTEKGWYGIYWPTVYEQI